MTSKLIALISFTSPEGAFEPGDTFPAPDNTRTAFLVDGKYAAPVEDAAPVEQSAPVVVPAAAPAAVPAVSEAPAAT